MTRTVVAILGSTRFKSQQLGIANKFTLQGKIVLLPGFWHHVDMVPITDEQKKALDELCFDKVRMADECFVVNVNGYIGETTKRAIVLAEELKKPLKFMEEPVWGKK